MLKGLKEKKEKVQQNNKELKAENEKLLKEKDALKNNFDILTEDKSKCEVEIAKLKEENDNVYIQNEQYWKENCHLKKDIKSFKKKVFMFENNQAVLQRRCDYFDGKVKSLTSENQGLLNDAGKINYENVKLKMEVKSREFENLKLKQMDEEKDGLISKIVKENDIHKEQLNKMKNEVENNNLRIETIEANYSELKLKSAKILKKIKRKKKLFCF